MHLFSPGDLNTTTRTRTRSNVFSIQIRKMHSLMQKRGWGCFICCVWGSGWTKSNISSFLRWRDHHLPMVIEVLLYPELQGTVLPSYILANEAKVQLIRQTLIQLKRWYAPSDLLEKADCLYTHLKWRVRLRIKARVKHDQHNNKYSLWARKNLAVVAAYIILADHVFPDITCLDPQQATCSWHVLTRNRPS